MAKKKKTTTKKETATKKAETKGDLGSLGADIKKNWKGHIVTTRKDDPPVKDGPQEQYLGMITEDDEDGHCKIDWMGGDEVGAILNFHFEKKWINKTHFDLES